MIFVTVAAIYVEAQHQFHPATPIASPEGISHFCEPGQDIRSVPPYSPRGGITEWVVAPAYLSEESFGVNHDEIWPLLLPARVIRWNMP